MILKTFTLVLLAVGVGAGVSMEAPETPRPAPFRLLHRQTEPPVELFVHQRTGACFVGYQPGGLVLVDKALCESKWFIIPPIIPPVSPER